MIEKEMTIDVIAEITGLSKKKIKELKDSLVRVEFDFCCLKFG